MGSGAAPPEDLNDGSLASAQYTAHRDGFMAEQDEEHARDWPAGQPVDAEAQKIADRDAISAELRLHRLDRDPEAIKARMDD